MEGATFSGGNIEIKGLNGPAEITVSGKTYEFDGSEAISLSDEDSIPARDKPVIGSGQIAKMTTSFDELKALKLALTADVIVIKGDSNTVVIHADDNILPILSAAVVDGTMTLKNSTSFSTKNKIKVEVTTERLDIIDVFGSGTVSFGEVAQDHLGISIAGSGSVTAAGKVDSLKIEITGSGDAHLAGLEATQCHATISGSGRADITVNGNLKGNITGSGKITHTPSAKVVASQIVGSGTIQTRDK